MLPARLKLPVPPGSDHQDFTTDILLAQSNLQIDAFPFLVVWLRFILICLNDLVFLLVSASGFVLVSKEWYTKHGMMEKTKIVVRITTTQTKPAPADLFCSPDMRSRSPRVAAIIATLM